jgi:apolipoprotein N-acyltransferase
MGYLFGIVHCVGTYWWSLKIGHFNIPNFIAAVLFFGLFFSLFAVLRNFACRRFPAGCIALVPALWVGVEYLRANLGFLSFPWCFLGHSQYRYLPVIQIADVTGVYGISFLLVLVNQVLAGAVHRLLHSGNGGRTPAGVACVRGDQGLRPDAQAVVALGLTLIVLSYGWLRVGADGSPGTLRIGLVQVNQTFSDNMSIRDQVRHMELYAGMSMDAARQRPHLIVWPASSLPAPFQSRISRSGTGVIARRAGTYLLVGGTGHLKDSPPVPGEEPYSNGEFLVSPQGFLEGQYNKVHLLPFNETIPLNGIVPWPAWITKLKGSFIAGKELTLFNVGGVRFGAPICWENLFPDHFRKFVARGADLMISVSNETFFGESPAPYQTLVMNVFRAVENRVAIARSNPTGISGFIRPNGRIQETVRDSHGRVLFVPGVLVRDLPLRNETTFFTRNGDLFAFGCIGLSALALLAAILGPRFGFRGRTP